jgi:HK97 family phage portal protein
MSKQATWADVQRRAAVEGSPILTQWKREREAARQVSNVAYSQDVMDAFGVAPTGVTVSATSAMRVSAVAACVAKIAGPIMSMPLHIYKLTDGDIPARLPRDDLWYLLNEQPSEMYSSAAMWEGVSMAQLLRGDAYALIRRRLNGSIREILPLPWGCVSPIRDPRTGVRYYVNLPSHGISTWFDPSEILHFPGLGFDDATMRSMSVIQWGARSAIGTAIAMDEYSSKFFENGAHPSIILQAPNKMGPQQQEDMQAAFARKYAGLANAHRLPLVLTEGVTAKEISLSAEDAQLLEARKFQVQDIARAFGVPGYMVNESDGASVLGSNVESIARSFVQNTLQPWLRKIEQELNRKLFPRSTGRFIEFYREALIEGDSKSQGEFYRHLLGGPGSGDGVEAVNEVRRRRRLPPIDDPEYDKPYRAQRDQLKPEGTETNGQDHAAVPG